LLAGLATGVWRSAAEAAPLRKIERIFKPAMKARERAQLIDGWRMAVRRVLTSQIESGQTGL
jgi:glycerol kinase